MEYAMHRCVIHKTAVHLSDLYIPTNVVIMLVAGNYFLR